MGWFRGRAAGGLRARLHEQEAGLESFDDSWDEHAAPLTRRRGEGAAPAGLSGWADGHVTGIGLFSEPAAQAAGDLVLQLGRTQLAGDAAVRHDWAGGRIDLMIAGGAHQVRVVLAGSSAVLVETVAARSMLAEAGPMELPRNLDHARGGERWHFASSVSSLDSIAFEEAVRAMHDDLDEAARAVAVTYMAPPGIDRAAPWAGTIAAIACMPTEGGVAWRAWTVLPATGEVAITTSELVRET